MFVFSIPKQTLQTYHNNGRQDRAPHKQMFITIQLHKSFILCHNIQDHALNL